MEAVVFGLALLLATATQVGIRSRRLSRLARRCGGGLGARPPPASWRLLLLLLLRCLLLCLCLAARQGRQLLQLPCSCLDAAPHRGGALQQPHRQLLRRRGRQPAQLRLDGAQQLLQLPGGKVVHQGLLNHLPRTEVCRRAQEAGRQPRHARRRPRPCPASHQPHDPPSALLLSHS